MNLSLVSLFVLVWMATIAHAFLSAPPAPTLSSPPQLHSNILRLHAAQDNQAAVNFIDPVTGCQVVLLGCFHGTQSSADDVEDCIGTDSAVLVLELCPTRFADLRRDLLAASNEDNDNDNKRQNENWIEKYVVSVSKTFQSKGFATGAAAALLGGVSLIQASLTGFQPGLEFQRAIEIATTINSKIILADQAVETTLQRMGSLPRVAVELLRNPTLLQEDAQTLSRSILGDASVKDQVSLPSVLTRNGPALQDLARLTLPPVLALQSLLFLASSIIVEPTVAADLISTTTATGAGTTTATMSGLVLSDATSLIMDSLMSLVAIAGGYLLIALPAVRVILTERDEQLARGIRAACRIVAKEQRQHTNQSTANPPKVVAVLGLLHVNGVAKLLLDDEDEVMK